MFSALNIIFLSALEQFDIIKLTGPSINIVVFTNLFFYCALYFGLVGSYFNYFSKTIVLSWNVFIKTHFFLFIIKLMRENLNMVQQLFFPSFFIVFILLLLGNLAGMIPYSLTVTSFFVVTSFFSWGLFLGINFIGSWINHWKFFSLFLPQGSPFLITPLLINIEIISYWARVVSLAIRLFANMMSGHSLLKILVKFLLNSILKAYFVDLLFFLPDSVILAITILEYVIALLQACVFVNLAMTYLNDCVVPH